MQDKAIGIVVFLLVGTVMTALTAGEGADWGAIAMGSVSSAATWATAITALAVAGLAMGCYTNGGLSGADIKGTVLLLAVAMLVGGTFPDAWGAWLALAWIVTGGLRT
jgi:hypothetical protein